jgi:bacterioferritin-associated ferredoxin
MDADERRGILVRADEVARQAFEAAQRVKEAVLRVPAQLAAQVAASGEPGECRRLMAEGLRAALRGAMERADGEEGATDGDGG